MRSSRADHTSAGSEERREAPRAGRARPTPDPEVVAPVSFRAPRSKQYHSPAGSASAGVVSNTERAEQTAEVDEVLLRAQSSPSTPTPATWR